MCLKRKFSAELQRTISSTKAFAAIPSYDKFEIISANHFATSKQTKNLREGHLKQSFIYFLIDPRISGNLPNNAKELKKVSMWRQFLDSIFYVGKAKTSRPYSHLYDAMKFCNKNLRDKQLVVKHSVNLNGKQNGTENLVGIKKLCRIIDIWQNGFGVVSLQAFHNILPCEAYTREAAIIDALSLNHLTNRKYGIYYGPAREWTPRGKKLFGISLLYRALQIFLAEGETQLLPEDLVKV